MNGNPQKPIVKGDNFRLLRGVSIGNSLNGGTMKKGNKSATASKEARELFGIGDCEMHFFGGAGYVVTRGYENVRISKVSLLKGSAASNDTIELKVLESMLLPRKLLSRCVEFGCMSDPLDDDVIPF
jgi:hypothetical protein